MRFVELMIYGTTKKYMLHVPKEKTVHEFLDVILGHFFQEEIEAVIYHFESGRFLSSEYSFIENGIESGDRLLLITKNERDRKDGNNSC